jgi:hypothetical protein
MSEDAEEILCKEFDEVREGAKDRKVLKYSLVPPENSSLLYQKSYIGEFAEKYAPRVAKMIQRSRRQRK